MEAVVKSKKFKFDSIRVVVNGGIPDGGFMLICSQNDFKGIVGDDLYEDIVLEEQILYLGRKKKESEGIIGILRSEVETLGAKLEALKGKKKPK